MQTSRSRRSLNSLSLNEIIEELERNQEEPIPDDIVILPPENCNAEVTDEDSGDENQVTLHNLPGSQLRAPAEILRAESSDDSEDSDDDNEPLSNLPKRRRISFGTSGPSSEHSTITQPTTVDSSSISSVIYKPLIPKNKQYKWGNRDNNPAFNTWQSMHGACSRWSPLQYFEMFFDADIINILLHYTNLYATQKNKLGNVTSAEIKCFLGILLYSGYVVVPRWYMYWQNASDCGMPIVFNAMSRDRFTFIMTNLHCCDNTNLESSDKFAKLRELFNNLNKNFVTHAPFEENYSIDEAMVPYYGGHSCKQFIRGKPIRWGYKFWVGATRLGYIIWFDPYQGQSSVIPNIYKPLGLGATVVLQYADVLKKINEDAPFHLFFDNFFTSIPLIDELRERGLKATGTIRENRLSKCPLPSNKELQKTVRGTFKYQSTRAEQIVVCKWHDNSVVTVTSNALSVQPIAKVKRFSQQLKKYVYVDQPAIIKSYNENMGGVDRSDQNIGLYRTSIRGKKWYFSLICHCLDMALHNGWQIYKTDGGEYDHLQFRRSVATALLETYKKEGGRKSTRAPENSRETSRYDGMGHLVKYRESQLRCFECHKKANFFCLKCEVTLHPKYCFEMFHTPK